MDKKLQKEECMMSIFENAQRLDEYGYHKLYHKLLSRLVDENQTESLVALGTCFIQGCYCVKKNKKLGLNLYKRASELGDTLGTFNMALAYKDDLKQYKKALYWFRLLKSTDYKWEVQLQEAKMYFEGLGVKKNNKKAKTLLSDILEYAEPWKTISQAEYEEAEVLLSLLTNQDRVRNE
jgi:TPR repeat protein